MTRQYFIDLRDETIKKFLKTVLNAPVRRGYNRLAGVQIPGKSDVTRACQANLRSINDTCVSMGFAPIWEDDVEVESLSGKPVK